MPYNLEDDQGKIRERLEKTYENVSDTAVRQFIHVFDSIFKESKDEQRAFAGAYAAMNKRGLKKKERAASPIVDMILAGLRIAEEAPDKSLEPEEPQPIADWRPAASTLAEILGGVAVVWTQDEVRIEDAGFGVDVHYKSRGRYMELSLGSAELPTVVRWLRDQTKELGVSLTENKVSDLIDNRLLFGPILCEILRLAQVPCNVRHRKEYMLVVTAISNVISVSEMMFGGPRASRALSKYFKIAKKRKRRRKRVRKVRQPKEDKARPDGKLPEGITKGKEEKTSIKMKKEAAGRTAYTETVSLGPMGVLLAAGRLPAKQSENGRRIWVDLDICPNHSAAPHIDPHKSRAYCTRDGTDCKGLSLALTEQESIVCHFAKPHRIKSKGATENREAIGPIPPRRGRYGVMFKLALKRVDKAIKTLKAVASAFEGETADDVLYELFEEFGPLRIAGALRNLIAFRNKLAQNIDQVKDSWTSAKEYEKSHHHISMIQMDVEWFLKDKYEYQEWWRTTKKIARIETSKLREVLKEYSGRWYTNEEKAVAKRVVDAIASLRSITKSLPAVLKHMLERLAISSASDMSQKSRPKTEKIEKLYHASLNAATLYKKGFSSRTPKEGGGLGGSQSTKGGGAGTSFTYDLYVAKEIARTFKELWLVTHGKVGFREIIEWARKKHLLKKTINNAVRSKNLMHKAPRNWQLSSDGKTVKLTGVDREYKRITVPLARLFDSIVRVVRLYRAYLVEMGIANKRYDPYIVGSSEHLIKNMRRVKYRDIGVVIASVDMTNPHIMHGKGEREFRVPPEAIISVDRLIR